MPCMLKKSNKAVKDVLSNPLFLGTKILTTGGSSLLLDHGDNTVTKITCDDIGYDWLVAPAYGMGRLKDNNPYKITPVEDYGTVGEISIHKKMNNGKYMQLDYMINAVRMPKLDKLFLKDLSHDQQVRYRELKDIMSVAQNVRYTPDAANYIHSRAEKWLSKNPKDIDFYDLIIALYYMCGDYHARPDVLTGGNILIQEGHIALVDPVFDPLMNAQINGYIYHPFDTPQGNRNESKKLIQA